jgi:anhydro-N-acetylmuramic acid kinase
MEPLLAHRGKRPDLAIGLMSGTSCDGVDAALVELRGHGLKTCLKLLAFETSRYSPAVRKLIQQVSDPATGSVDLICQANVLLGELFAEAALSVAKQAGVPMDQVALIGSHGQTVHHLPRPQRVCGRTVAGTLQLGEPAVIAERTGVCTVADFRPRDMACGGEGAPLVPYVDYLLFRHPVRGRLLLNIGGIANVTHLPAACSADQVLAFDTGPGNMLLDGLVARLSDGRKTYDRDGAAAAKGHVHEELLTRWLQHPFLRRKPPKSTGRETFGTAFLDAALHEASELPGNDLLATATAFTARSIHEACERFVRPRGEVAEVIVSGGGVHNATLMTHLEQLFRPATVTTTDGFGIPPDAKEAVAFAVLAHETLAGRPGNLPSATGAEHPAILGTVVPGKRLPW